MALFFVFKPLNAYADIVIGDGGATNGGNGGGNDGSCGGSTGVVCPMTLWVYYTIIDRNKPAYIGSHNPYASTLKISDCGPYGGFWIYQRTSNEKGDKNTLKYRVATGARQRKTAVNAGATSSTMIPLKGVYNDENENVTPSIPNYPGCASSKSCTAGGDWLVSEDTVKGYFRENNGGSTNCTIGSYSGDCFGSNSPLTYFCYGDDPERDITNHVYYDKNTTNSVSGMPSTGSCSCTTTSSSCSCKATVAGSPSRTGYKFLGWSTNKNATSGKYTAGDKIKLNGDTTLYAVWKAYDVAKFSAPDITITSTDLAPTINNSDTAWKGLGDKISYDVTAYYHVKRTNSTPSSAYSNYGTRSAASDDGSYPSNGTSSGDLTNGNQKNIPTTYSVSVSNGSTATACFYFRYDSEVYYDGTSRVGTKSTSTAKKCITVYNPTNNKASFSGSISISNGADLSGSGASRTGSGYKSTFTVTGNYSITRTDGFTVPSTASSNYATNLTSSAYNANSYPSSVTSNTGNLGTAATNKTKSWTSSSTVDISIGGAAQNRCFYLRYDTSVLYYDNDRQSGNFAGKNYACVSITNPAQKQTISFTGAPVSGTLTANSRLERSDSNRVGTIINHDRITGKSDDTNGRWTDNTTAMNATYTADFSHKITRTDDSSEILGKTMSANVSWQVQYAYPSVTPYINDSGNWVVSGVSWADYASSLDNKNSAAKGTTSLGASDSVTINTQPKLKASQGQILYYCQRVAYTASITYSTKSVADKNDYDVDGGTPASMTTYSSPLCVTLKNPKWSETDAGHLTHNILVSASPSGTEFTNNQFIKTGSAHETLTINSTLYINHTVKRDDTTGDDESDSIFSGKFYQPSIYSNNAYKVTTNLSGYELITAFDSVHHLQGVTGGRTLDGRLAITLGASSKYSSDSFTSNYNKGASKLDFNATGDNKYSVMAGQTRTFSIASTIRPSKWTVEYKKINLNEYYDKQGSSPSVTATSNFHTTFDRIEKYHSSPQVDSSSHYESSPVTFSVSRPYNFKITAATPSVSGVGSIVAYDDDSPSITYTVNIDRENTTHAYITDPNHTGSSRYVYPVSYIMPATISTTTINNTATGIHPGTTSDICSYFSALAKPGSCKTYTDSSHPTKLSATSANATHNPAATPTGGGVVDTVFRHVYSPASYTLTYRTGNITIENPDGSPLQAGEKFCIALAIKNYSSASNAYFISNSTCRNISKRPSLQAWGGSIISSGGINTSESTYKGARFGSWTDFAVIANKNINLMNSGATAIGGIDIAKTLCDRSPLTIANKNCEATENPLGYSDIPASTDFVKKTLAYFTGNTTLADVMSTPRSANQTSIIKDTSNTITITSNIINNEPTSQVVIIARNINITSNVTRIDAWLIATDDNATGGTIDTCSDVADGSLSTSTCTSKLEINGQLYAGNVKLKRTYGGDPAETSLSYPAEVINYTPSTYLWGDIRARDESNPRMVYLHKLPTRY